MGRECGQAGGLASSAQVTVRAILINILNPKLSIFFLAFLPQFVSADESNPLASMLQLSAVFMLMTLWCFVGYGLFAGGGPRPRHFAPAGHDLDAAFVRLRLSRVWERSWPSLTREMKNGAFRPRFLEFSDKPQAASPCWWSGCGSPA
jgi:hypothetical protein